VAGIVAGAPASPKLSYASERTTKVNLTAPEFSGGGRGTTRRRDPGGAPHPACGTSFINPEKIFARKIQQKDIC
jgi:hypothetical protein